MGAEGDDEAVVETERAVPVGLLLGGAVNGNGVLQVALLVKPPSGELLPPLVPHRPRRSHAMRRPHNGDSIRPRPLRRLMIHPQPEPVDM